MLPAHADIEHEPRARAGISRFVEVVTSTTRRSSTSSTVILPRNQPSEFLELRIELHHITQPLTDKLVEFLGSS